MPRFDKIGTAVNKACASALSNVEARFHGGEPIDVVFRQVRESEAPGMRRGPVSWMIEGRWEDLEIANPTPGDTVTINSALYEIVSPVEIDASMDKWARIRVRPTDY